MTTSNDPRDEMSPFLSPDQVEQVLSGAIAPEDLPDRAASVARLFSALSAGEELGDVGREQEAVAAIAAAIRNAPTDLSTYRIRSPRRLTPARAAAAAFAIVIASGTAAAAATGSLPDRAQRFVSRALSHAHIEIPSPEQRADQKPSGDADRKSVV